MLAITSKIKKNKFFFTLLFIRVSAIPKKLSKYTGSNILPLLGSIGKEIRV